MSRIWPFRQPQNGADAWRLLRHACDLLVFQSMSSQEFISTKILSYYIKLTHSEVFEAPNIDLST